MPFAMTHQLRLLPLGLLGLALYASDQRLAAAQQGIDGIFGRVEPYSLITVFYHAPAAELEAAIQRKAKDREKVGEGVRVKSILLYIWLAGCRHNGERRGYGPHVADRATWRLIPCNRPRQRAPARL